MTSIAGPSLPSVRITGAPRALSPAPPPASENEPLLDLERARKSDKAAATSAVRYGHFVNWDDNSFSSLKRNAASLDVLIVEWLHLAGPTGALVRSDPAKEALVSKWTEAHAPHLQLFPLVNNYSTEEQRWDIEAAVAMLSSTDARARFAEELWRYAVSGKFDGLVLDLEQIPVSASHHYVALVGELAQLLAPERIKLLVAVPASDPTYDYVRLAQAADGLIVMAYDEHHQAGAPGPIAGQGWFEQILNLRFENVDPQKLIVGIASFGYEWTGPGKSREISVQEAWELLEESGAKLRFDAVSLNPTFTFVDDIEGKTHHVWYLDGVTAYNQIAAALTMRPAGLALWRLGTEDPGVWAALGRDRRADDEALKGIRALRAGYDVLYKGKGEVLSATGKLETGTRGLTLDAPHNLITDQIIEVFPRSTTVMRWGARTDKVIALTFDDGPDRRYTGKVLDVLRERNVKATFFIVGSPGAIHSDLLLRIHQEGHDIGNHTFSHVNSSEVSIEHLKLEINATQRLFEATLGIRTMLFRPPYARDLEPQTIDGVEVLRLAGDLGYLTIGMGIDPKDWYRPRASQIVSKTVEAAEKGDGNVVLLHDAGGIRDATVEALPLIIDQLRAKGFSFVTIHELLGLSREEVMPTVEHPGSWIIRSNHASFMLYSGMNSLIMLLFGAGIALGTLRLLWVCSFAILHARLERLRWDEKWRPASLAVIVPAFNEEKVICSAIRALLASRVRKFTIIVVDDGSTDQTAEIVRKTFAGTSRVRVLTKPNEGKWAALNWGIARTAAEIVVTLDADTLFEPDALALLLRHFADPSVAAVAGNATVGNRINTITRFQALEYVTNQNLDRRALEIVNGIPVVPGSIGAWRRSALLSIGGFQADTLAEDADATIRLERAGWRVVYEPRAVARTEAPETLQGFLKQRLRWMFGTLQVAYKNRGTLWQAQPIGVSLFTLPNIIVFQFFFTLVAPIVDIMFLWAILTGFSEFAMRPHEGVPPTLLTVGTYWAYFQLVELGTGAFAVCIERKSNVLRLVPLLLLQRFCYRQLLYATAVRVAVAALKGRVLGWNKLIRTGTAAVAFASNAASRRPSG